MDQQQPAVDQAAVYLFLIRFNLLFRSPYSLRTLVVFDKPSMYSSFSPRLIPIAG